MKDDELITLTGYDFYTLGRLVRRGEYFGYQGKGWDKTVKEFSKMVAGNPEKCHELLCVLRDDHLHVALDVEQRRQMMNFYFELMLFMADKTRKDN